MTDSNQPKRVPPHVSGHAVPGNIARDGAGKNPTIHEAPPPHIGMQHTHDGGIPVSGFSRTQAHQIDHILSDVDTDPTLLAPAEKNIATTPPPSHPGMVRQTLTDHTGVLSRPHPDEDALNADTAQAIFDEAVQPTLKK